ncbi:MAG: hypothetical protein WBG92_15660 [Thiohalocapsa sp.]
MPVWFTSNLGDAALAAESLDRLKHLFVEEYGSADRPQDLALFYRHESEGRLHCEVKVYFSPASAVLAKSVAASPCARPAPGDLGLLVGSQQAWSVLFPGTEH